MNYDKISNLIKSQVPFFVRNDHEKFVTFLEKYYEYLEQDSKVVSRIKTSLDLQNIDLTEDEFADHLYNTFMKYIPKNIDTDRRLLVKHIKDFYRAKGTEKSIRFLMNALYHVKATFYYPKQDVIRASDGKWYIQRSLRVTDTLINNQANTSISALEHYVGTRIMGATSNANAIVERVERIFEQGTQIDEIILSNIDGEFVNGETIRAKFNDIEATSNISSNIFSGLVNTITIENAGSNYLIGDPVIIVSAKGQGAAASVAGVTTGNIVSIAVTSGGAGYRVDDNVLVIPTGGGGGASAKLDQVIADGSVHPNSYNIMMSTISIEANTPINNTVYSNLNSANANVSISNACSYWSYANTGPAGTVIVINSGENYSSPPALSVLANTRIQQLGILGRMEIVNGGSNYRIGDPIEFVNVPGCLGTGARANVTNVGVANTITEVRFVAQSGHTIGGSGYSIDNLPLPRVVSNTGSGANIVVTALVGTGAKLRSDQSEIGSITRIVVTSRGRGYDKNTSIDLTQSGDGRANASVSIIEGIITYPGRWLNDDGHLDSYNFLQDRDFYQNYSYVIRSRESISKYRSVLKNLTHPAGTKMFGEFLYDINALETCDDEVSSDSSHSIWLKRPYVKTGNTINIAYGTNSFINGNSIGVEFISGNTALLADGRYVITNAKPNYIVIVSSISGNTSGNASIRTF